SSAIDTLSPLAFSMATASANLRTASSVSSLLSKGKKRTTSGTVMRAAAATGADAGEASGETAWEGPGVVTCDGASDATLTCSSVVRTFDTVGGSSGGTRV